MDFLTFSEKFKEVNDYEITKFIRVLFNEELFSAETTNKVPSDFKKTLSELIIGNLSKKSKEVCNRNELKINCEAGGPGLPALQRLGRTIKSIVFV